LTNAAAALVGVGERVRGRERNEVRPPAWHRSDVSNAARAVG
jgi:hypothetical protein